MSELIVGPDQEGLEALAVLAEAHPRVPTAELRRLLTQGAVTRGSGACGPGQHLQAGEVLTVDDILLAGLPRITPARLAGFAVVYEAPDLLAVNKPAGVPVEAERGQQGGAFKAAIHHHLGERSARPRLVHRLDKDTSGVVLVALTREALRELTEQFEARSVEKEYLALVRGVPREEEGRIELALEVQRRPRRGEPPVVAGSGKHAATAWRVVERFGRHTLLRAHPETGRQHQLRAHLAAIGHPIVADAVYGGGECLRLSDLKRGYRGKESEKPLLSRGALHARRIAFQRGVERVEAQADLPRDMTVALKQLRRRDPP